MSLWSCPVRRGAELPFTPQLPHGFQTAASPYHFPITGQLGDLLALACGTPSRGWSQSQDWWSLVRKGAGAQARSLLESRYNEKLPEAGSVIKLSSWADFLGGGGGGCCPMEDLKCWILAYVPPAKAVWIWADTFFFFISKGHYSTVVQRIKPVNCKMLFSYSALFKRVLIWDCKSVN